MLLLLGLVACSAPKPSAVANITNLQTETLLGVAKFTETKKGVILNVELQAEKNVTLAVHIHQYGNCSDADGKSAGGHWNPTEENHGAWGDGSFHSGDLGNITTDKNGKGSLEVLDVFGRWSLDEDKITSSNLVASLTLTNSSLETNLILNLPESLSSREPLLATSINLFFLTIPFLVANSTEYFSQSC